jgi:hypothetical protein
MRTIPHAEWLAEAERRFGWDPMFWRFVCPSCGHVASIRDWKDLGVAESGIAVSCLGCYTGDRKTMEDRMFKRKGGPCNYCGEGRRPMNPVIVDLGNGELRPTFAFAEMTTKS